MPTRRGRQAEFWWLMLSLLVTEEYVFSRISARAELERVADEQKRFDREFWATIDQLGADA